MTKRLLQGVLLVLLAVALTACGGKKDGNEEVEIPSSILETKEDMGDGVLYYIPNENVEAGFTQSLILFQEGFLLYGFPEGSGEFKMQVISRENGEVLAQTAFTDMDFPNVQICGNQIAISDWATGKVIILDEELQVVSEHQTESDYNSIYVSTDAQKIYMFMPEDGLVVTDISSGEMEMKLENVANLYISNKYEDIVIYSYTDRRTLLDTYGALNLETGKIMECPFERAFSDISCVNGIWMASDPDEMNTYYVGNDEEIRILNNAENDSYLLRNPVTGNLQSTVYDENGLVKITMYNVDGEFLSEFINPLQGAFVENEMVWSEADGGYFFILAVPEGYDRLMFWDMNTEVSGENLDVQPVSEEILPEEAVSKELYTTAKAIGYKHGIEIRIAEQMDEDYSDYKVEKILDEEKINAALDMLGKELSIYPEGFFDQLLYGSIREIEIHLAGTLTNLSLPEGEVNGFTSYSGFAQTRNGKAVVALDMNEGENLPRYLHHELFHLIDEKMMFAAGIKEDSVYSEEAWMELNPEGFEYAGTTFELPEELYNEEYDVWFIDMYSRTMPREDRARIMEYAMTGDYNMFISAPHRQAKLEYLNQCIRDSFDTFGWPEKMVWEETLENSY